MSLKKWYYVAGIVAACATALSFYETLLQSAATSQSTTISSQDTSCGNGSVIFGESHCSTTVMSPDPPMGPREKLQRQGISWSDNNYFTAWRNMDKGAIVLFLDGGMPACTSQSMETGLAVPLTAGVYNGISGDDIEWSVKQSKRHGCDLNRPIWFGDYGHTYKASPLTEIAVASGQGGDKDLHYIADILVRNGASIQNSIKEVESGSELHKIEDKPRALSFLRSLKR